ncbi:hypothetical protein [Labrenzia sp. PHM005]|uniref:hypothetical protein n=1 Tax=Labrenzia sp. PHM005 TaxID=2590016 RepID=UPI00113FDB67|nr:hypothetical protein [Labrenzia sp. PHM005]QDG75341.1 hypothetical protein FJ695_05380 [Labrenzia sp. PHM005]
MQVQPIAAIRPIKIQPKPVGEVPEVYERDARPHPEFIPTANNDPQTSDAEQTDKSRHAVSDYTAHLLITHQTATQTVMDRTAQMARYATKTGAIPVQPQISLSV